MAEKKFCGDCGGKLTDGKCKDCDATKSATGLSMESLEKSLTLLEDIAKGVRPGLAKKEKEDNRTPKEVQDDVIDELEEYGDRGEGESEEEPKTTKVSDKVKKGFRPPVDDEEEEDPRDIDPREDEDEDEDEERAEARDLPFKSVSKKKKTAKKSFSDSLQESNEVRKAVDVSDFLRDVVESLVGAQDTLTERVEKSIVFANYQKNFNHALAKSLTGMAELVKSLNDKLEVIAKSPVGNRKSDLNVSAIEKSFNIVNGKETETLTKSQIAERLFALRQSGDNTITSHDVAMAESTGMVSPAIKAKLGIQ